MSKKSDAIKALRAVAAGHYNKTLPKEDKQSGICWAAGAVAYWKGGFTTPGVYATVNKWCAKHITDGGLYLAPRGKHWNQRAMFALLLAESMS